MTVEEFNSKFCSRFRVFFTFGKGQSGNFFLLSLPDDKLIKASLNKPLSDVPSMSDVPEDLLALV